MINHMDSTVLFESCVYRKELPEYLEKLNKICDPHIHRARENKRKIIEERKEMYKVDVGDHGMSYHSEGTLDQVDGMQEFELLIRSTSKNIFFISFSVKVVGFPPFGPTKLRTPGVFSTTYFDC